ncbi:MAG: VOC family protein [Pseudomonadota bacterium]
MPLILERGNTQVDHVAIGVPDTVRGVEEIADRLGVTPRLVEPEPDQFYWSGSIPLGAGNFLEILGPNPAYNRFNPFIEMVKQLEQPQPLFWYVATHDFAAFQVAAKQAGTPVERVETVKHERRGIVTDYTRGYLGPGFLSVSPNVIQWRSRSEQMLEGEGVTLLSLELKHPEAERLNAAFDKLGIRQQVKTGPHKIAIKLDTPNGETSFAGDGLEVRGLGMLIKLAKLYARWRFAPAA